MLGHVSCSIRPELPRRRATATVCWLCPARRRCCQPMPSHCFPCLGSRGGLSEDLKPSNNPYIRFEKSLSPRHSCLSHARGGALQYGRRTIWRCEVQRHAHSSATFHGRACCRTTRLQHITRAAYASADLPSAERKWLSGLRLHSEFDAAIFGLAVPALFGLFLDPVMSFVETGESAYVQT